MARTPKLKKVLPKRAKAAPAQERIANRMLAFTPHCPALTEPQVQTIREFEIELNSDGKPTLPPSNAAATLLRRVFKRSRGTQDAARASVGHGSVPPSPKLGDSELLRFFAQWVLLTGRSPEVAEAAAQAFDGACAASLLRTFDTSATTDGGEQ